MNLFCHTSEYLFCCLSPVDLAEGVGLEPTYLVTGVPVFKTGGLPFAQPSAIWCQRQGSNLLVRYTGFTVRPQIHYEIADKNDKKNKTRITGATGSGSALKPKSLYYLRLDLGAGDPLPRLLML